MTELLYTNTIEVGSFYIRNAINAGKIWIGHESGEGGEFPIIEFEEMIKEFYDKRF